MKKEKNPSGYFNSVYNELKKHSFQEKNKFWSRENYLFDPDFLCCFPLEKRKYIIKNWFRFRGLFISLLFFVSFGFSFQGVGDCEKLLSDYAQLGNKSIFLPSVLSGHCVVQNEKHFPYILKSAGYSYKEKNGYIDIKPIPPYQEKPAEPWQPKSLYYDVSFVFLNTSSALDCGLKMGDIVASSYNLNYSFSLGLQLGCPALDFDGSFAFRTNAHLLDLWEYSHGLESKRDKSTITSATGAVTTEYEYLTTGLYLALEQKETGVTYRLRYTGQNVSVTTNSGGIIRKVTALVTDEYTRTRYFGFLPLGKEKILATYTLILRIEPATAQ